MESSLVKEKYADEIKQIMSKLNQLRANRVYEITNVKSDGFMSTNIDQLEKMIKQLIYKIDNNLPSNEELISDIYKL